MAGAMSKERLAAVAKLVEATRGKISREDLCKAMRCTEYSMDVADMEFNKTPPPQGVPHKEKKLNPKRKLPPGKHFVGIELDQEDMLRLTQEKIRRRATFREITRELILAGMHLPEVISNMQQDIEYLLGVADRFERLDQELNPKTPEQTSLHLQLHKAQ